MGNLISLYILPDQRRSKSKYGILISIRIVYGGLQAYIHSTYINSFAPVRHFYKPQTEC